MSTIGFALNAAGDDIRTGDDSTIERVASNVVFAGGLLSCLFWVRWVHTMLLYMLAQPVSFSDLISPHKSTLQWRRKMNLVRGAEY